MKGISEDEGQSIGLLRVASSAVFIKDYTRANGHMMQTKSSSVTSTILLIGDWMMDL